MNDNAILRSGSHLLREAVRTVLLQAYPPASSEALALQEPSATP